MKAHTLHSASGTSAPDAVSYFSKNHLPFSLSPFLPISLPTSHFPLPTSHFPLAYSPNYLLYFYHMLDEQTFADLQDILFSLPSSQRSVYSDILATANYIPATDLLSPSLHSLFKSHGDDEIQVMTNGVESFPVGTGEAETVAVSANDRLQAWTNYLLLRAHNPDLPVYLIHNHPSAPGLASTLPSPSDVSFWRSFEAFTIPAIYVNSTDTVQTYNEEASQEMRLADGLDTPSGFQSWSSLASLS